MYQIIEKLLKTNKGLEIIEEVILISRERWKALFGEREEEEKERKAMKTMVMWWIMRVLRRTCTG